MKKSSCSIFRSVLSVSFLLCLCFLTTSCGKEKEVILTSEAVDANLQSTEISEEIEPKSEVSEEKKVLGHGIDVSKWQGQIDWKRVKEAGVDFAMIRLGYRDGDGLYQDPTADYNLREAEKYEVPTGVYFYSNAKNENEAIEEADWVLEHLSSYAISYPVVMDVEIGSAVSAMGAQERTQITLAFLEHIQKGGYEPMLYAPLNEFEDPDLWEATEILGNYLVWIASYDAPVFPETQFPKGEYEYAMWQYSNTGSVDGIGGAVDRNVAYFS